jgi:hypothetical protein
MSFMLFVKSSFLTTDSVYLKCCVQSAFSVQYLLAFSAEMNRMIQLFLYDDSGYIQDDLAVLLRDGDGDSLDLSVGLQPILPQLTPNARHLIPENKFS